MAECELLKSCPFFNDKMPIDSGMGAIYKKKYCAGDKASCARYKVVQVLGKGTAPIDLYPNMAEKAETIIASG